MHVHQEFKALLEVLGPGTIAFLQTDLLRIAKKGIFL